MAEVELDGNGLVSPSNVMREKHRRQVISSPSAVLHILAPSLGEPHKTQCGLSFVHGKHGWGKEEEATLGEVTCYRCHPVKRNKKKSIDDRLGPLPGTAERKARDERIEAREQRQREWDAGAAEREANARRREARQLVRSMPR